MADFDINAHLAQLGFGRGAPKSADGDGTNEKSTVDALFDATGKVSGNITKLTGVPNLSELGQHGLQKAFGGDTEGITGKMIMPSFIPDMQGGFLARLLHSIFLKNREITDNTGGSGGGGGDYSGSAGGGASGGDFGGDFISQANYAQFDGMAAQSSSYEWSDVSWASLGGLPRPSLPDVAPTQDVGMNVS